ncbi:MAG: hypothetical protein SOW59_00865, partial [Corynebacterium sp.]|nr:hypothetical protein [Corynebacterium sp.]
SPIMKRFIAATVAVATAFSLSNGVASAASSGSSEKTDVENFVDAVELSSEIVDTQVEMDTKYPNATNTKKQTSSQEFRNDVAEKSAKSDLSSTEGKLSAVKAYLDVSKSSIENDYKNNYKFGTTTDILIGVGIVAAIFAVIANFGQVAGFKLPAMPNFKF